MLAGIKTRYSSIAPLDSHIQRSTQDRFDQLAKPLGSLGELEQLAARLGGMTRKKIPTIRQPGAILFAADHGVSEEGVSAYGTEVTEEMTVGICMGNAVSSVLARSGNVKLLVVDVGVKSKVRHPNVLVRKVAPGTQNFTKGPAMSREQAYQAVQAGIDVADQLIDAGHDLILLGEMGIGNTTACSAMLTSLLSLPLEQAVGRGTWINNEQYTQKQKIVSQAIQVNHPSPGDPWDVLEKVGGLEIGALAGAIIACASRHVPIVLDGMITGTAALWAARLNANVKDYLIASHQSVEPAHEFILKELNLNPLVKLNLRLGEGSGGLLVLPILQNACKILAETATFEDARVTNPYRSQSTTTAPEESDLQTQLAKPIKADFTNDEKEAVYKAIFSRRDIRVFLPDPIPDDVLERILSAAHHAPSVGFMQPWNFILVRDKAVLTRLQEEVERERVKASEHYQDIKQEFYLRLKVEGILQAPLTICVTNDSGRGGPHVLGRNTNPETDLMSTSCAIQNMWLAARAEGIGIGWVSIYQKQNVSEILNLPEHINPVALLTVGYTPHFPEIPGLERGGWGKRLDLESLVYQDSWGTQLIWPKE